MMTLRHQIPIFRKAEQNWQFRGTKGKQGSFPYRLWTRAAILLVDVNQMPRGEFTLHTEALVTGFSNTGSQKSFIVLSCYSILYSVLNLLLQAGPSAIAMEGSKPQCVRLTVLAFILNKRRFHRLIAQFVCLFVLLFFQMSLTQPHFHHVCQLDLREPYRASRVQVQQARWNFCAAIEV